jgi:PAS domain S-box-containing protein
MKKTTKSESAILRQKAEALLKSKPGKEATQISHIEILKLVHELEVHQIELELQNDDLKLARSAALETAEKFVELYDFAPSGYLTLSKDGKIMELNLNAAEMLGKERAHLINRTLVFFVSIDSKPVYNLFLGKVFNNKIKESCDVSLSANDNQTIYVHLTATIAPSGENCLVTMLNITERKLAEKLIQESEMRFRNLSDSAPVLIWMSGTDALCNYFNRIWLEFTGRTMEQEMGNGWAEGVHPDDFQHCLDIYLGSFKTRQPFRMEYRLRRNDGKFRCLLDHGVPRFSPDGQFAGYIGSCVDITESKEAKDELRNLNETLEQRVAERTKELEATNRELEFHVKEIEQFTYIASHDLQEPLNTLTNFTRLIQEEYAGRLDEDGNKSIEFICYSATRMKTLVKGILDYSRLGKDSILTMVDCNKIVGDVLADMPDSIKGCNANIKIQQLPVISGYETELRLLFQNLIHNAIKFQFPGVQPEITISAESLDMDWKFAITDNGIGIKEQDREKIFVIFKRMVKRSEYEGTGIGLAHCKKIVELHGGKIWVEAAPGTGSTFMFTIPKKQTLSYAMVDW